MAKYRPICASCASCLTYLGAHMMPTKYWQEVWGRMQKCCFKRSKFPRRTVVAIWKLKWEQGVKDEAYRKWYLRYASRG